MKLYVINYEREINRGTVLGMCEDYELEDTLRALKAEGAFTDEDLKAMRIIVSKEEDMEEFKPS